MVLGRPFAQAERMISIAISGLVLNTIHIRPCGDAPHRPLGRRHATALIV